MSKPLLVEIIAYAPTAFYHCTHCEIAWREIGMSNQAHKEQLQNSLPGRFDKGLSGRFRMGEGCFSALLRPGRHQDGGRRLAGRGMAVSAARSAALSGGHY